jgi:CRP-like cAMP-binding protein
MYYLDENGNEFTCQISFNPNNPIELNQFAVDFNSFISQSPSRYFIEALSDLSVLEISYDDFKILVEKIPSFRELESKINQMITGVLRDDLIDINVLSNDERYDIFLDRYKKLPIKIPQYIIASYLGITPAALSRLKKRQ